MTYLLLRVTALPSHRLEILELLTFCASRLHGARGCVHAEVYEAVNERRTILYVEEWITSAGTHRHIQSDLYRGVLAALDLADGSRDISFHLVSSTRSMDLIESLRGSPVDSSDETYTRTR